MKEKAIFFPATENDEAHWFSPSECLWEGPAFIKEKHLLKPIYAGYELFFHQFLNIGKPSWRNFLAELLTAVNSPNAEEIWEIYQCLHEDAEADVEEIR